MLTRYLSVALISFLGSMALIAVVLVLLGHIWPLALGLGLIWSLCLQFLAWGIAYVLWPVGTSRFQERLRRSYGSPLSQIGRDFDRRLGFEIDPANPSVRQGRLLGLVVIVMMLAAGLGSSWLLLFTIGH